MKIQKILNISTIVLTIILWALQMLPKKTDSIFLNWIKDDVYIIAAISAAFVIFIHCADLLFGNNKNKKRWLRQFLCHIIDEHLGGNVYNTRIGILKRQSGLIVFGKSVWFYLIVNFINNFKNRCWREAFKKIAIHILSQYLVVYVRYCYPKTSLGCTYFRLSDKASRRIYNGIANKCYVEGVEVNVMTSYIGDIEIKKNLSDYSINNKKRIQRYMKDSFIDESFYDTLKGIRRISNNLYAVPIALDDQSIWGVVIVDSDENREINFKKDLESYMASYMKIINFSLSALK